MERSLFNIDRTYNRRAYTNFYMAVLRLQLQLSECTPLSTKQIREREREIVRVLRHVLVMHMQDVTYRYLIEKVATNEQEIPLRDENDEREIYILLEKLQKQLTIKADDYSTDVIVCEQLIEQMKSFYEEIGRIKFVATPSSSPWFASMIYKTRRPQHLNVL